MPRKKNDELSALVLRLAADPKRSWPIALVLLAAVLFLWWNQNQDSSSVPGAAGEPGQPGEYLFCFWNVENLFDDRDDKRAPVDEPYDNWFAHNVADRNLKFQHLSEALLKLNGGKGPDILACVEVENVRAAELLRDALNARLSDPALHYAHVLMKEVSAGRHIAPVVITRLPVRATKTHLFPPQLRILESHIDVNGHDLTLIASHWTSHLSDDQGGKRERYADIIYKAFRDKAGQDSSVDLLVCGDFNDSPDEPSVRALHTTPDSEEPRLLNLMAGKDPSRFGSHYYSGKLLVYDQIAVSRGLLDDRGWSCDPDSVATVNTLIRPGTRNHAPWRFGNEKDNSFERGYSDHFPVTVRLKVR